MVDRSTTAPTRVLLTVSGTIPDGLDDQVAEGRRPRADYRMIADRTGADIVDVPAALATTGAIGRTLHRLGAGSLLGWYCFRRRRNYDVIITDGEQVGLPLALLSRVFGRGSARHVMIVHILSVPKKVLLIRACRLARLIDRYLVYCSRQAELLRNQLGVPAERIDCITFMVDSEFFRPDRVDIPVRRMICTAGLERRDYPTLMEAVDGLDVEVVIAAASPWSKQADSSADRPVPSNVRIEHLSLVDLRELYAASEFVVMPLVEVDFQAGITTILEAMSMTRPVVCTRTLGQTDTVVEDETGIYVPSGDALALRRAIEELLDDPAQTRRMGKAARRWVVEHADIESYADRIAEIVASTS